MPATNQLMDAAGHLGAIRYHMHQLKPLLPQAQDALQLLDDLSQDIFVQHIKGRSSAGESLPDYADTQAVEVDIP